MVYCGCSSAGGGLSAGGWGDVADARVGSNGGCLPERVTDAGNDLGATWSWLCLSAQL